VSATSKPGTSSDILSWLADEGVHVVHEFTHVAIASYMDSHPERDVA